MKIHHHSFKFSLTRLLPVIATVIVPAHGELLFQEQFAYPAGALAGQVNPVSNTTWGNRNGTNTNVGIGNLEPVSPADFRRAGGSVLQNSGSRVSLDLSGIAGIASPAEGSSLYVSFVQKLGDSNSINQAVIFELWRGAANDSDTIFSFGTNRLEPATDYGLLIEKLDADAAGISLANDLNFDANLVVLRVDYGAAGAVDTVRIYLNPTDSTEPAAADGMDLVNTADHDLSFDTIGFGSFQGGTQEIDEIRIATTFEEVVPAFVDSDMDGLPDSYEMANNLDPNNPSDADADPDSDDLSNLQEFNAGTNPQDADTDGDQLTDGQEVNGTLNAYRVGQLAGEAPLGAPGAPTDPLSSDSDDDGLSDGDEVIAGDDTFISNPNLPDTDDDGLPDDYEVANQIDPADGAGDNGAGGNLDEDDLSNIFEFDLGTNPRLRDTDADGYDDHVETNIGDMFFDESDTGTDPLNPDSDGDGLLDGSENPAEGELGGPIHASDPNIADTDGDGFSDFIEVFFETDPIEADSQPSTDPVVATMQFDFDGGPEGRNVVGIYAPMPPDDVIQAPAHSLGILGDSDRIFNRVWEKSSGSFFDSSGAPIPSVGVDIGISTDNGNGGLNFEFDQLLQSTGQNNINPDSGTLYRTALYGDWLFTTGDENLVVRVNGLAAGSYNVFLPLREEFQPGRTYDVFFGTQVADGGSDPVFGAAEVGVAGAPASFAERQNFFRGTVSIEDNEFIVVMVDPTNAEFGFVQGLQIVPAAIGAPGPVVTSIVVSGEDSLMIDFRGNANSTFMLGQSDDLTGDFPALDGVTATTDADGLGSFTIPFDSEMNPKSFFRLIGQ